MALVKYNNNSISAITTAGQLATGNLVPISEQTASGSASIEFTTGIDSTYPIYRFEFINMHPSNNAVNFQFNMSTDGGSNYNVTKTTTAFLARHSETGTGGDLQYKTGEDLAQSTSDQILGVEIGADADQNLGGTLQIFNPSSSVFVKHFISTTNGNDAYSDFNYNLFIAGYGNTTSAVNAIKFQMSSGNIDAGEILLFGIN